MTDARTRPPSHARQLVASLLVAVLIAAIAVAVVTARLGPGGGDDDSSGHGGDRIERVDSSGHGSGGD